MRSRAQGAVRDGVNWKGAALRRTAAPFSFTSTYPLSRRPPRLRRTSVARERLSRFAMMVVEVVAGITFVSMGLLDDGIHTATHAGALALATAAYVYARRHLHDPRLAFGTGNVGDLSAFASAIMLGVFASLIGWNRCRSRKAGRPSSSP